MVAKSETKDDGSAESPTSVLEEEVCFHFTPLMAFLSVPFSSFCLVFGTMMECEEKAKAKEPICFVNGICRISCAYALFLVEDRRSAVICNLFRFNLLLQLVAHTKRLKNKHLHVLCVFGRIHTGLN